MKAYKTKLHKYNYFLRHNTFTTILVISLRSVLLVEETIIPGETTDLSQVIDTFYPIMLYRVHLATNRVRTHNFRDSLNAQVVVSSATMRSQPWQPLIEMKKLKSVHVALANNHSLLCMKTFSYTCTTYLTNAIFFNDVCPFKDRIQKLTYTCR
jgi:hypothetical protein